MIQTKLKCQTVINLNCVNFQSILNLVLITLAKFSYYKEDDGCMEKLSTAQRTPSLHSPNLISCCVPASIVLLITQFKLYPALNEIIFCDLYTTPSSFNRLSLVFISNWILKQTFTESSLSLFCSIIESKWEYVLIHRQRQLSSGLRQYFAFKNDSTILHWVSLL